MSLEIATKITLGIAIYGAIVSTILGIFTIRKERRNFPIIKFFNRPKWDMYPVKCQKELIIGIKNKGYKDAKLNDLIVELKKGHISYLTKIIYPKKGLIIESGYEGDLKIGMNIYSRRFDFDDLKKNRLPFKAIATFYFNHREINKSFWIGRSNKLCRWINLQKHILVDHHIRPILHKIEWYNKK